MTAYVVGLALDEAAGNVLLIRKSKPEWQAGLLNGVGGKIETVCALCYDDLYHGRVEEGHAHDPETTRAEAPVAAMYREFAEETGRRLHAGLWREVAVILHPDARVHVFACQMGTTEMGLCRNDEGQGESLEVHHVLDVIGETMEGLPTGPSSVAVGNLPWLLALACYRGDRYRSVTVLADSAEVAGRG